MALEEGLDDAGLGGGAELVQGEGDEAVGGAGAAREAADGECDVVFCAGDLDAGEEVWIEVVEAVVDGALLDVACAGVLVFALVMMTMMMMEGCGENIMISSR